MAYSEELYAKKYSLVQYLELCFTELEQERENNDWNKHWAELRRFILPRSGQNDLSHYYIPGGNEDYYNENYGGMINDDIINDVAGIAVDIIAAGLQSGITNPTMPWFSLEFPEHTKAKPNEKKWLDKLEKTLVDIYQISNFYKVLPRVYEDLAVYGTAALGVFDHEKTDLRFEHYPIGTYWISQDEEYHVNKFFRLQAKTVDNVVREFCMDGNDRIDKEKFNNLSSTARGMYLRGSKNDRIQVMECIVPSEQTKFLGNADLTMTYKDKYGEEKEFKFVRVVYEREENGVDKSGKNRLLHKEGYHMFPILVPRWSFRNYDVYGRSPCMRVLGNVKVLQSMEKSKHIALQKMVSPPVQSFGQMGNRNIDLDAGAINSVSSAMDGAQGLQPIYTVSPNLQHFSRDIEILENRINRMLYTGLFEAISNIGKSNATATEINAIQSEKLLQLGPLMTSLEDDLLRPLVDISVYRVQARGLIEEAPPSIQNTRFTPIYISLVAMSLMTRSRENLTMFENLVFNLAARQLEVGETDIVTDNLDYDAIYDIYALNFRVPASISRSKLDVEDMRNERAQRMQAAQMAELQAEQQTPEQPEGRNPSIAGAMSGAPRP